MRRSSRKNIKININILKEIGYIILLITFFIGILVGSLSFSNISDSNFEQYKETIRENLISSDEQQEELFVRNLFYQGIRVIGISWIIGMSVVGTPVLIAYLGYKGFSIGYTISTVLKVLGTVEGNKYVFQNLFLQNLVIVFIMIFLANYSIKIFRHFFENKENIKADVIKYTIISTFIMFVYIVFCMVLGILV